MLTTLHLLIQLVLYRAGPATNLVMKLLLQFILPEFKSFNLLSDLDELGLQLFDPADCWCDSGMDQLEHLDLVFTLVHHQF